MFSSSTKIPVTPTKKQQQPSIVDNQTLKKTNATKQELPTKIPVTPTKTNATKEGVPTPTIKKDQPLIVQPKISYFIIILLVIIFIIFIFILMKVFKYWVYGD